MEHQSRKLVIALKVAAFIEWIGFGIVGIVMGATIASYSYGEFNFWTMLLYWVIGFIAGITTMGIAYILDNIACLSESSYSQLNQVISLLQKNNAAQEQVLQIALENQNTAESKPESVPECSTPQNSTPQPQDLPSQNYVSPQQFTDGYSVNSMKTEGTDYFFCPECGTKQLNNRTYCYKCGARFIH